MDSVIATGKIGDDIVTVIVSKENEKFSITFNGEQDVLLEDILKKSISIAPLIDGYYIPTNDMLLGFYNTLNTVWFDKLIHIIVEGEMETIPYDDDPNIIY